MVGIPLQLIAAAAERTKREHTLREVSEKHAIKDYQGVRINGKGAYFIIKNALLWTIMG